MVLFELIFTQGMELNLGEKVCNWRESNSPANISVLHVRFIIKSVQ